MLCRILLADDYPLFRAGIRALLEKQQEYEVVGEAGDGQAAIELASRLKPDIVLLDMSMERMNSVTALKELSLRAPHSKVLMLSMHTDTHFVMKCLQLGAHGYLLKTATVLELEPCHRRWCRWWSTRRSDRVTSRPPRPAMLP